MAYIERKKNGSVKIIVPDGYDNAGRQIRPSMTIKADELTGLTERQKDKEIERRKVLFEKKVKSGTYLDGEKITFGDFADKWYHDYAEKRLAPGTLNPYRTRLYKRIIPALGHIKLAKLQPHHLMDFYNNLSEGGIRLDAYYKPINELISIMASTSLTTIARQIGIDAKTYTKARNGDKISFSAAEKICTYFNRQLNESFQPTYKSQTLSDKSIKHHHDLISSILSTAV